MVSPHEPYTTFAASPLALKIPYPQRNRAGGQPVEDYLARHGPTTLDTRQLARMLEGLGWQSLKQLPLEA